MLFRSEAISATEYFCLSMFLLIARTRYRALSGAKSGECVPLLTYVCVLYGVFKHAINLFDFPFDLTDLHMQLLASAQFALQIVLYLLAVAILCPSREAPPAKGAVHAARPHSPDVVAIPPMIEFGDKLLAISELN